MFADTRHPIRHATWAVFLATVTGAFTAHGQTVAGQWRAGTTTMDVKVTSWGPNCGPRPTSSRSAGGGIVRVELDGQEAIIHSSGRKIRTDRCWSRNPAIRRKSSRFVNGTWTTHCQTARDDPRAETGKYILRQRGPNQLHYVDESQYDWELNASRCVAVIRTEQQLQRVRTPVANLPSETTSPAPVAPSTRRAAPTMVLPEPPTTSQATTIEAERCTPSVPTRLTLRPVRATLELGQELCVRARLTDALGCPVPGTAIRYTLQHSPALQGRMRGRCFRSNENAAEGEGHFRIRASAGPLTAITTVDVHSLDLSGLIAQRLEVGGITGQTIPGSSTSAPALPQRPAIHVSTGSTVTGNQGPSLLSIALATLAIVALLTGYWSVGRRRTVEKFQDEPVLEDLALLPKERHATTPPAPFMPAAASPPDFSEGLDPGSPGVQEAWICPHCRRGQPAKQTTCRICPNNVQLMPYAQFVASARKDSAPKQCRTCGTVCESDARFCGECGGRELTAPPPRIR